MEIFETNWGIARSLISTTPLLFVAQLATHLISGEHGENLGRLEGGKKWRAGAQNRQYL